MCLKRSNRILLVLSLVFVLFLPCGFIQAQKINSPLTLEQQNGLWNQLLERLTNLPKLFEDYNQILLSQANLLQISNQSLTTKNQLLMESLTRSGAKVVSLETKLETLQKSIDSSIIVITDAQKQANVLIFQNKLLKIGLYSAGIILTGEVIYLGGKALKVWK
jgi:predicted PurR-regulated permease PerM